MGFAHAHIDSALRICYNIPVIITGPAYIVVCNIMRQIYILYTTERGIGKSMTGTLTLLLSGLAVGAAMAVPGVSGGTAAMVLGIYDKLVRSLSRLFSEPKKSLPLLLKFGAGGIVGMLLVARLISFLLTTPAEIPLRFLFLGAVAGGVPVVFRSAELRRLTPKAALLVIAGAAAAVLLTKLPEGIFIPQQGGLWGAFVQFIGGILVAAALILPGISASHFLYMLGMYDYVMEKLGSLDFLSLLPLAVGAAVGAFLTAKVLEALISSHRKGTFMVILGFMLASLQALYPVGAGGLQLLTGGVCAVVGFIAVYWLQGSPDRKRRPPQRMNR